MNRKIVFGSLLACFLILTIPLVPAVEYQRTSTFENIIYVDDDNTDGPWDGTQEHPYMTIQAATGAANDGDTVFVYDGVYDERVEINKSINITGEDRNTTFIERGCYIYADEVIVTCFTIRKKITDLGCSICLRSSNNKIYRNIILGNTAVVVEDGFDHNEIFNNHITGRMDGICLKSNDNVIQNNTIEVFSSYGILLLGADHNLIQWNDFSSGGMGIGLSSSSENTIKYNNFRLTVNAYFVNSYGTTWDKNYWLFWNYKWPKPLLGRIALFWQWNLPIPYIPSVNFDWHPAEQPYEI